jgi:hypothetical protein
VANSYPKVGVLSIQKLIIRPKPKPNRKIIFVGIAVFKCGFLKTPNIQRIEKPTYKPIIALKKLYLSMVFLSNRNNGGGRDTNLFIAEWQD